MVLVWSKVTDMEGDRSKQAGHGVDDSSQVTKSENLEVDTSVKTEGPREPSIQLRIVDSWYQASEEEVCMPPKTNYM